MGSPQSDLQIRVRIGREASRGFIVDDAKIRATDSRITLAPCPGDHRGGSDSGGGHRREVPPIDRARSAHGGETVTLATLSIVPLTCGFDGREGGIRTRDLSVPNAAR